MQSRHSRPGAPATGSVRPDIDRLLAEIDQLLAPPDTVVDRLIPTWPPPSRQRPLFAYGVFAHRALRRRIPSPAPPWS
ncbi:MAG: hypothetical protein ACRD03_17475 [Acidimicrobiales bacterium]